MKPKKPGLYILIYLSLIFLFLCFVVPGALVLSTDSALPARYASYRYIIAIPALFLGFTVLFLSVKFMLWAMRQMATNLDILFRNLALSAESYGNNGRHYFGNMDGRRVDIYCKPVKNRRYFGSVKTIKYIGHALDIYVAGDFCTRSSIGLINDGDGVQEKIRSYMIEYLTKKFVDNFAGQIIKIDDPGWGDFVVYALDPNWTSEFIKNDEINDLLMKLMGRELNCLSQHVDIMPRAIRFRALTNIKYIKSSTVDLIVNNLNKIAQVAEALPKADITSEETEAERIKRMRQ